MLPAKTSHRMELDRMWRSSEWRQRFEAEMKFKPLGVGDEAMRKAANDGSLKAYHDGFNEWGRKLLEARDGNA